MQNHRHPTYHNLIFDLFDVLVVTNWKAAVTNILDGNEALVPVVFTFFASEGWRAYKNGLIERDELVAMLPQGITPTHFQALIREMPQQAHPIPEMIALLATLKDRGYNLYLLSNVAQHTFSSFEQQFDFMRLFNGVMTSFQAKATKPDPKIYQALLDVHGLNPASCLFVDDKEANVLAGQRMGIEGIVFSDYPSFYRELVQRRLV